MMLGFKFSEIIIMTFKKKGRPYKDKNIKETLWKNKKETYY